jgi:hypothetical protein
MQNYSNILESWNTLTIIINVISLEHFPLGVSVFKLQTYKKYTFLDTGPV